MKFGLERAFELIFGGSRLDEGDFTALVAKNYVAIDGGDRCGTASFTPDPTTPFDIPREQVDANREAIVMTLAEVQMIANQHHPTVMVLQFIGRSRVLLDRLDPFGSSLQFDEGRAAVSVARGTENIIPFHNRRGDIGDTVGDFVVAPEVLAVAGSNPNQSATNQLHILFDSGPFADRHDRVARTGAPFATRVFDSRSPDFLAGFFIETNDHGFGTPRGAEDPIAVDQW